MSLTSGVRDNVERLGGWLPFLEAAARGEADLDDVAVWAGLVLTDVASGRVAGTARCPVEWRNLGGISHGGYPAALLDTLAGYAALTTLAPDELPPTVQVSLEYLRAIPVETTLDVEAHVVKRGRRLITVDSSIELAGALMVRATFLFTPIAGLPR